jgi:hypothetical protein
MYSSWALMFSGEFSSFRGGTNGETERACRSCGGDCGGGVGLGRKADGVGEDSSETAQVSFLFLPAPLERSLAVAYYLQLGDRLNQ